MLSKKKKEKRTSAFNSHIPTAPPVNLMLHVCVADAIPGVLRWQARLWGLVTKLRTAREGQETPNPSVLNKRERSEAKKIWENKNYAITQVKPETTLMFRHVFHKSSEAPKYTLYLLVEYMSSKLLLNI